MSDTNSRITIRLEDGTPPVPGSPPVPPSVGTVTPPDTLGGTPSPGSSAPETPVPPVPATGAIPGPAPGSVIPNMPIEEAPASEPADSVDADYEGEELHAPGVIGTLAATVAPFRSAVVVTVVALEALVDTVQALDASFQEMAERGGEYDAGIAQANAVADLRLTLAEMRRANELSEELAGYMDERSQLSVEIKDAITELSRAMLPLATEVIRSVRPAVRGFGKLVSLLQSIDLHSAETATILKFSIGKLIPGLDGMLLLLESIDDAMPKPASEDFSNFRRDLEDFLNPVTSRVNAERELAAAMALPDRDRVFPAFRP